MTSIAAAAVHPDLQTAVNALIATYGREACLAALGKEDDDDENLSLLEASFDASFVVTPNGSMERVNQAAVTMFGYDHRSELIGKPLSSIIGGGMASMHQSMFDRNNAMLTQQELDIVVNRMRDVLGKRKDNSEFPLQVGIRVVTSSSSKNKTKYVAYCHDLTRHKRQLDALEKDRKMMQQEKELLNRVLDASFDAILVTNGVGTIQQVNKMALQEFGYESEQELIGQNIRLLVGGGHAKHHDFYMQRFRERGHTHSLLGQLRRVTAQRKDGTDFPCQVGIQTVSQPQQQEDGSNPEDLTMVGFVRNITKEVEAMELAIEKRAAEELLVNMLPKEVALRLKEDPGHIADHFTTATVLFADICGFTKMSTTMEPIAVVGLLNDLFSRFDEALDRYGLNKVKTIGDCYMVTSIPGSAARDQDPRKACAQVCHFAIDLIQELHNYNEENPDKPLNLRVGINTGSVVAGVVGKKRFLYDIWGHAVNLASRMESTGVPGKIQVSQDLVDCVQEGEFAFEARGEVHVKGVGDVETYFLKERLSSPQNYRVSFHVPSGSAAEELKMSKLMKMAAAEVSSPFEQSLTSFALSKLNGSGNLTTSSARLQDSGVASASILEGTEQDED